MTTTRVVFANGALWWKTEQAGLVSWGRTRKQAGINFNREHPAWLISEVLRRIRDGVRQVGDGLAKAGATAAQATAAFKKLGEVMGR